MGQVYLLEYLPIGQRGLWGVFLSMPWALGMAGGAASAWVVVPWAGWRAYLALTTTPYSEFSLIHISGSENLHLVLSPPNPVEWIRLVGAFIATEALLNCRQP